MLTYWQHELHPDDGAEEGGGSQGSEQTASQVGTEEGRPKRAPVVTHSLGMAILALEKEGSIALEYVERKKLLLFSSRHVVVTKRGPTSFPPSSFEAQLWAKVGEKPTSVRKLVRHWFGGGSVDPWGKAFGLIQRNLVEVGLLRKEEEDAHRGRVARALAGTTRTVVHVHPQVKALQPQIEASQQRIDAAEATQGELPKKVFGEVTSAIWSKKVEDAGG